MEKRFLEVISTLKEKLQRAYGTARGPTQISDLGRGIPEDYAIFLSHIGGGTIGEMRFELYDKPLRSSFIYGDGAPDHLKNLLFIGDDYNGFCVGLDPDSRWAVVEVDKYSLDTKVLAETLFDFLLSDHRFTPSDEPT